MKKGVRKWKRIKRKLVYQTPWLKLWEDNVIRPDGKKGTYGYLDKPVGVFIIAYSEKNKSILLLKQHRYPIQKTIYEIPAGVTKSDNFLSDAKRELREETGLTAKKWQRLGSFFVAPGHESSKVEVFLASKLSMNSKTHRGQEGDEAIQKIIEVKVKDLPKMILQGKIECGITLASLNLFSSRSKI
jgi:8-oxo-dGTP pyrophosphatase MutT (NUDIX family)